MSLVADAVGFSVGSYSNINGHHEMVTISCERFLFCHAWKHSLLHKNIFEKCLRKRTQAHTQTHTPGRFTIPSAVIEIVAITTVFAHSFILVRFLRKQVNLSLLITNLHANTHTHICTSLTYVARFLRRCCGIVCHVPHSTVSPCKTIASESCNNAAIVTFV